MLCTHEHDTMGSNGRQHITTWLHPLHVPETSS
jgi:hypothetical protein